MSQTVNELRSQFLKYFELKGHRLVRSSPLIPHQDPTLLFINAGMNQFKDYFTGRETPRFATATSCQKCVRAGGKHNDLESVGKTKRHHTFFEMLGNFSFGEYFKEEAMALAWDFLTNQVGLDPKRLWISVFEEDDEALEIWTKKIKVPADRVVKMGEKDNFWAMGDTGPCGPCSEIYYDRGETFGKKGESIFDGGERFLEIWNLVFMQFERFEDGSQTPLPKPCVDTGMGLERLASVVQDADSNYDIDGMQSILQGFAKLTGVSYGKNQDTDTALKVLTDHIRACSFLISDGVQPSNEGRGYVLRRILRRAIRFGKNLGQEKPFFYKGVSFVVQEMGEAYPELSQNQVAVEKMIQLEEEKFYETLDSGLKLLEEEISQMKSKTLDGAVAFKLYDTFGFPLDLTQMILEEKALALDEAGFDKALEEQRARSRKSWKGNRGDSDSDLFHSLSDKMTSFKFTGYESVKEEARILSLIKDGQAVEAVHEGDDVSVVLDHCPFYAESGGQVGDTGEIKSSTSRIEVLDTRKPIGSFHVMDAQVKSGIFKVGDKVSAEVDEMRRRQIRIHHTMTHVLHATLQEVLGDHIKQAGSLVQPDYLRFDFSHFKAVTSEELKKIEAICNQRIRENPSLRLNEESMEEAIKSGAKAFFEDKYGDQVRVLRIGGFSTELCGGIHAESLAEAGLFKITQESSVASGVRRIMAVTGQAAYEYVLDEEKLIDDLSAKLKTPKKEILQKVEKLVLERQELTKKLSQKATTSSKSLKDLTLEIEKISAVVDIVSVDSAKSLRPMADDYKNQIKSGVVVLGAVIDGKASVVVSVSKDLADFFDTRTLVGSYGDLLDGKGGGRPDFAQVGGSNTKALSRENLVSTLSKHIQTIKISA